MAPEPDRDRELEAAGRLRDLARRFQERSEAAEAALVRDFETQAGVLAGDLGLIIMIEDDDDEQLWLTDRGEFRGEVLTEVAPDEPTSGRSWKPLGSPEDIVDFYDPVDLFGDLIDALEDEFPVLQDVEGDRDMDDEASAGPADMDAEPPRPVDTDPWFARSAALRGGATVHDDEATPAGSDLAAPSDGDGETFETATMKALRDLHAAGVYTDAEFAAKKAELGQR